MQRNGDTKVVNVEQKVMAFVKKHDMIAPHQGILIGLSGGADSVALLEVLCHMRKTWDLKLAAVHVHHGIRKEAQQDADFCEALCKERQIAFYCEYVDVPKLAKEEKLTVEEAGRKARYILFEQYRQKLHLDAVAVAHHQNDQAETMLFQLFRGTGLRGMSGIPVKRDTIIRPLLAVNRTEIEAYLKQKNRSFVTDATNLMDVYTRNKIRQHILPVAEEIAPKAVENMNRTGEQLGEIFDFMQKQAREFLAQHSNQEQANGKLTIALQPFAALHPALQKMIIIEAMECAFDSRKDITQKHIEAILQLLEKEGEKTIQLPKQCQVVKQYEQFIFEQQFQNSEDSIGAELPIEIHPNQIYLLPDGRTLQTSLIFSNNLENIPKNDCTKWFDYDKIRSVLMLRNREQGDFLTINDNGSKKKLQDYLVNEKVPKSERDKLLVLADGSHIVWVPGMRISAYYKVTPQTNHILQVYMGGM